MENVTLDEIAKRAGVNKSTVSKALRHSSDINNDTAEKIRQIAADLGYNPAQRTTQVAGNSMLPVHLAFYQLSPDFTHKEDYTSRMTHLLHKEFSKHGIMLFESYPQQSGDFEKLLASGNVEALLLLGNFKLFDSSVILTFKRFIAAGKPVILLCNYLPSEEGTFFSIRADDFTAGWQATNYCIEKKIEKIAFVRGLAWQA
ncbi:MAG: LacI family DNA-binding transcriptional regulator, partial [Fibrobacteres bacterium]|nr:LacI family DNA-binding transcriptional regulator [Fibrobacterota bacterium]